MPKPEEKPSEEKLEELKEKSSNITETEDGGVSVTVEEENQQEEMVQEVKKEEVRKESKPDSLHNKVYAQDRILSRIQQQLEGLQESLKRIPSDIKPQESEADVDELDKIAQSGNWKKAVSIIAERKATELLDNERRKIQIQQEEIAIRQVQDRNSEFVLAKHSELSDTASEKSQLFQAILNNNPRWRTSPDGPLLTMYAMEDELRKRGYDVDGTVNQRVEKETNRLIRANNSSLPASRADLLGNKITLTREQKEFCDTNGISYEDYARTLRKAGEGRIEA